jgi:hypothetical protein
MVVYYTASFAGCQSVSPFPDEPCYVTLTQNTLPHHDSRHIQEGISATFGAATLVIPAFAGMTSVAVL